MSSSLTNIPLQQWRTRLSNVFAAVLSGVALIYILVLYFYQHVPLSGIVTHIIIFLTGICVMVLNRCGKQHIARTFLILTSACIFFAASIIFHKSTNALLLLYVSLLLVYFLYDRPHIRWLYTIFIATLFLIGILLLERFPQYPPEWVTIRQKVWATAPLMDSALVFAFITFFTIRFVKANERYVKLIVAQKEEIESQRRQLELSEQKLLKINHLNRRVLAVLSHDMRNALYGLKNYIRIGYQLMPGCKDMQQRIDESVQQNIVLLEDLLQWAASEMTMPHVAPQAVYTQSVMAHAVLSVQAATDSRRISLTSICRVPQILANEDLIKIVLRNLLMNAIQHCPEGGSILLRADQQEDKALVEVSDKGTGMPPELVQQLLDGTYKGNGIGLLICRDYLHRMGSELHIESKPGEGSRFYFSLPIP